VSKTTPVVAENITLQVSTDTHVTPASVHWDFGDGQAATTVMTSHQWAAARTYAVSVQVTMPDGQHATTSMSLAVSERPKAKLTVTAPTNGTISGSGVSCPGTCSVTVDKGQSVTLTATPAANYKLSSWGGACSGAGTCKVTLDANKTVSATFTVVNPVLPYVGTWMNADPNTGDVKKIIISNATPTSASVHGFGACGGGFCDWGTVTASYSGGALHAFFVDRGIHNTLTIKMVGSQLSVRDDTHFDPPDTRQDFTVNNTFTKTG
jgi:hypothetical protein